MSLPTLKKVYEGLRPPTTECSHPEYVPRQGSDYETCTRCGASRPKPEPPQPWFNLRLPYENGPSAFHPLRRRRWRRRHERILRLERENGYHDEPDYDVLPWLSYSIPDTDYGYY